MKKLVLAVVFMVLAVPASADLCASNVLKSLWIGPSVSYTWYSDVDFGDYNILPALALGYDGNVLDVKVEKVLHFNEPDGWLKEGPYRAEASLKLRF